MMSKSKVVHDNPELWKAFYAGLKFCYTTEIPPLRSAREAFKKHLSESDNKKITDNGRVYTKGSIII